MSSLGRLCARCEGESKRVWHSAIQTRVVFAGQSLLTLEWLCARQDIELLCAFIPPQSPHRAALVSCCAHAGVPVVWATRSDEVERALPPAIDLGLCATFERLSTRALSAPRLGWLNVHPAPLPERPGRLPTVEGALAGDRGWAGTIHWMSARLDAGDLIERRPCPVSWRDGPAELEVKGTLAALAALTELWDPIVEGYAPRAPQPQPARAHISPRHRESLSERDTPERAWRLMKACAPFGGVPMRCGEGAGGVWVLLVGSLLDRSPPLAPPLAPPLWVTPLTPPAPSNAPQLRLWLSEGASLLCAALSAPLTAPPPPTGGPWTPWRPQGPTPLTTLTADEARLFPYAP
jgi:methionyl-tRNA formyltransferase